MYEPGHAMQCGVAELKAFYVKQAICQSRYTPNPIGLTLKNTSVSRLSPGFQEKVWPCELISLIPTLQVISFILSLLTSHSFLMPPFPPQTDCMNSVFVLFTQLQIFYPALPHSRSLQCL